MLPTDLTVSAVVEQDGHFLIVEERASGVIVLNQPGGHIESGESPEEAVAGAAAVAASPPINALSPSPDPPAICISPVMILPTTS